MLDDVLQEIKNAYAKEKGTVNPISESSDNSQSSRFIKEILNVVERSNEQRIRESREMLGLSPQNRSSSNAAEYQKEEIEAFVRRASAMHPDYNGHPDAKWVFEGELLQPW